MSLHQRGEEAGEKDLELRRILRTDLIDGLCGRRQQGEDNRQEKDPPSVLSRTRMSDALDILAWGVRGEPWSEPSISDLLHLAGYLAITDYLPEDPDMIYSVVYTLYDQGEAFHALAPGEPVDKASLDYPFMPPFVGTEEEMEALVEYLASLVLPAETVAQKGGI